MNSIYLVFSDDDGDGLVDEDLTGMVEIPHHTY